MLRRDDDLSMSTAASLTWFCVLLDLVGLTVGLWLQWHATPRGHERWWRELATFTGFGLLLGVVAVLGADAVADDQGAMVRAACHALFCVLAPILILRGVWLLRRRGGAMLVATGWLFVGTGLGMEATYLYAREWAPRQLQVTHHRIQSPRLQGLAAPIRVAIVADLHAERIGAYERRVFARLSEQRPDLVLLLGDYVHLLPEDAGRYDQEYAALSDLLAAMPHRPRLGMFAIEGDCEPRAVVLRPEVARTLCDEHVDLPGDVPIRVWGLGNGTSHLYFGRTRTEQVAQHPGFTIVMGHAPEFLRTVLEDDLRPDSLWLAGHCHGGQICLPGHGPLVTLSGVPRAIVAGGLHRVGETWLLVSRGVGVERGHTPPLRLFCPPEIVVIELAPGPGG